MDIILYSDRDSPVHRVAPRARVMGALILTVFFTQVDGGLVLLMGLGLSLALLAVAQVPLAAVIQRLVPLNVLLGGLCVLLVFSTPGEALFRVGHVTATLEGLQQGAVILIRGNVIVALLAALVGTIEFVALGKALGQLGVPAKLVHILLFTIRYINLMLAEYERMSQAALLRGFRPGLNRHTLTTTGYFIGMILVRSFDRGARMLEAMKLRGYDGTVTLHYPEPWRGRDSAFLAGVVGLTVFLGGMAWT